MTLYQRKQLSDCGKPVTLHQFVTLAPRPPRYINFFEPFHFTAGDQLVLPIGASHIFYATRNTIEGAGEKEQANNMFGLTQVQKESYVTLCMCRLTLVWILAKLLQSYWNADSYSLSALDFISSDSSLSSPVSTGHSRHPSPTANFSVFFFSLSDWRSLPTSGHTKISSPKTFVWFRAKTDKGIVCLADHLHSVTG